MAKFIIQNIYSGISFNIQKDKIVFTNRIF